MYMNWYGRQCYTTTAERDAGVQLIKDFADATLDTVPYGETSLDPGIAEYQQLQVGEDSGPGFTWCYKIPDTMQTEAGAVGQSVQDVSLSGESGIEGINP